MMNNLRNSLGILFCVLTLVSCASAGNPHLRQETESSVADKVKEGETTKSEIKAIFGSPDSTSFTDGGLEIWKYYYIKSRAAASTYLTAFVGVAKQIADKKELTILFDDKDIVKRFTMSESRSESKNW